MLSEGICVTHGDYGVKENHAYNMRLDFVPIEERNSSQDVYGWAFMACFKVTNLHGGLSR